MHSLGRFKTKYFTISSTAIAMTCGAMLIAATPEAQAAGTTTLRGLGQDMFRAEQKRPATSSQSQTSTATSASTSSAALSSAAKPKTASAAAKPKPATDPSKPDYHNPQTLIDQFKKSPVTASFCEPHHGSACFQKIGIPNGKGGETLLDLHFTGLRGQLLPADQARLDKALADAEKVYLSRPGGGTPPLDIHTVHHAN